MQFRLILRLALAVVAGIGAVMALIITPSYRMLPISVYTDFAISIAVMFGVSMIVMRILDRTARESNWKQDAMWLVVAYAGFAVIARIVAMPMIRSTMHLF